MKFDWENWDTGGRIIFSAACVAFASMFMGWVGVGMISQSGIQQGGWILLFLWFYPLRVLLLKLKMNRTLGISLSVVSMLSSVAYINWKTVELFGNTANVAGTGAWLYMFSSIALAVGVFKFNALSNSRVGNTFDRKILNRLESIGVAILILGLFLPLSSTPRKSWSYFELILVGRVDAIIVFCLAMALIVFALRKNYSFLYATAALCLLCFSYNLFNQINDIRVLSLAADTLEYASRLLGTITPDTGGIPELHFGWWFLFIGVGVILLSPLIKKHFDEN